MTRTFRVFGKTAIPKTDGPGYVLLDDEQLARNWQLEALDWTAEEIPWSEQVQFAAQRARPLDIRPE